MSAPKASNGALCSLESKLGAVQAAVPADPLRPAPDLLWLAFMRLISFWSTVLSATTLLLWEAGRCQPRAPILLTITRVMHRLLLRGSAAVLSLPCWHFTADIRPTGVTGDVFFPGERVTPP